MRPSSPQTALQMILVIAIGSTAVSIGLERLYGRTVGLIALGQVLAVSGALVAALWMARRKQ